MTVPVLTPATIIQELQRYLVQIQEDLRNHPLASVRGSALTGRLRLFTEGAIQRARHGRLQIGQLVPIRALLRDISSYTTALRTSNIIRIFVARERVAQQLRTFQLRISNLSSRLQIALTPYLSADDIRTTAQDNTFFNQVISRYLSNPESLNGVIRTMSANEMRQVHATLSSSLYMRPNRLVSTAAVEFAHKVRQAIERILGRQPGAFLQPAFDTPATGSMPPISDIQRDIGSLPSIPGFPSPRQVSGPLSRIGTTSQPAFNLRSPLLESVLEQTFEQRGSMSAPMHTLGSPSGSVADPQISSLDLGSVLSPDPVLFEDSGNATNFGDSSLFPPSNISQADLFGPAPTAGPSRVAAQATPPANGSTSLSSNLPTASPLLVPSGPPRPIVIRYHDTQADKMFQWRAFHGWLWPLPHMMDSVTDYNGQIIERQSIVTVIAQFVGLDETQRQAILDHVSVPSKAPALLRQAIEGDKLRVLRIYSIRNITWLACVPVAGGKPGFIPSKATILNGNPPQALPRVLAAPIHGSVRSFNATYRFTDSRGALRVVTCTGVVQPFKISYHEVKPFVLPNVQQVPVRWLHFPYSQLHSVVPMPPVNEVKLVVQDRNGPRAVHLHFQSGLDATHFVDDVQHMRRITRQIIELQERRRREAGVGLQAGGQNQNGATAGTSISSVSPLNNNMNSPASPRQAMASPVLQNILGTGMSPYLGALHDAVNQGNHSPHLSQLGSPLRRPSPSWYATSLPSPPLNPAFTSSSTIPQSPPQP